MVDLVKLSKTKRVAPKAELNFTIDEDDHISEDTTKKEPVHDAPKIKKHWKFKPSKKILIIGGVIIALIVILGLIYLLIIRPNHKPATKLVAKKPIIVKPIVYTSPLSGLVVTKAESILPITGVMIENTDFARPQSGLSQAGIVFEAIAEAGITRFLALFEEGQPTSIGPIRSARPYYVDWLQGFDASYVHVGGSPDALTYIQSQGVKDLNQFYNGNYFTRITTRDAPHNVYTSMSQLNALNTSKGYTTSSFTLLPRKTDQPLLKPSTTAIDMNASSPDFEVNYVYDAAKNSYKRSEAGAPMIDANTNLQIEPKVVIAIIVPQSNGALDSSGAYYTTYGDIGSGNAYIFQDGGVTKGVWAKTSPKGQITFKDANGYPIKLNTGQVWITALGLDNLVTYSL